MIVLGNVLSVLGSLLLAGIAMFVGAFWDDPNAPPYPTGIVLFILFLLAIFVVFSIVRSHANQSLLWAYAPVGAVILLGAIGFFALFGFGKGN